MKKCTKCGVTYENDASFCLRCGNLEMEYIPDPIPETPPEAESEGRETDKAEKTIQGKKQWSIRRRLITVMIGIVIFGTAIGVWFFTRPAAYEDVIAQFVQGLEENDAEQCIEQICPALQSKYEDLLQDYKPLRYFSLFQADMPVGQQYELTYEITASIKANKNSIKNYKNAIYLDTDEEVTLEKGYYADVVIQIVSKKTSEVSTELEARCFLGRIDGTWYIIDWSDIDG